MTASNQTKKLDQIKRLQKASEKPSFMNAILKIGSVVRLKSLGPDMTVVSFAAGSSIPTVTCSWFAKVDGEYHGYPSFADFSVESLERVR